MCDKHPTQLGDLPAGITADGFRFWRAPTAREVECGIYELADAMDSAEVDIAARAAAPARDLVKALVVDTIRAVKDKDAGGVARITPASLDELAQALKAGQKAALDAGRRQVIDQRKKQRGAQLAMPPRKTRKLAAGYLTAKAEVDAESIANAATKEARRLGLSQVARGVSDSAAIEEASFDAATKEIVKAASTSARESMAIGRLFAIQDLADEIETIVYTAILDNNVCEECEQMDGEEYPPDEAGKAPNDNCVGEQYGNVCRCAEVVVFAK